MNLFYAPTDLKPNLPLYLVFDSNPTLAATHTAFDHIWQGQIRLPVKINIIKP